MHISFTFKNFEPSEHLRKYARRRMEKMGRFFGKASGLEVGVVLTVDKFRHRCEVTIAGEGLHLSASEQSSDMYAAIDLSADKVTRQLRKFKTKVVDNRQGGASAADVAPVERVEDLADLLLPEEEDDLLVREKVIDVTPMTEEQALVQTDLLGHDFYVFENATTGLINVVYHRKNGGYGIIKPRIETLDE